MKPWQLEPERIARRIKWVKQYGPILVVRFQPWDKTSWLVACPLAFLWHDKNEGYIFHPYWRWGYEPSD